MKIKEWVLQDEANAGDKGGGGGNKGVAPADARAFVSSFVTDPKLLETMPDDQVVAYHGRVSKAVNDAAAKAIEGRDWRKDIAGDNPDAMKTLERLASPKALYESYDQLRTRLSKGELKAVTPYPDKGTAEQQAAWRAENGIPEAPEKYEIKLADGVKAEETDKPFLDKMLKAAHAAHVPPSAVNAMANWFFQERAARMEAAHTEMETLKKSTEDALRAEWGPDYRATSNKIQGLLDSTIPADQGELKEQINKAIATNPHFARHYAALALQLNPTGTLVSGDAGTQEKTVVDEIKAIEAVMAKDRPKYNKDEAMQQRYRDLLGGYQRLTGKEWSAAAA